MVVDGGLLMTTFKLPGWALLLGGVIALLTVISRYVQGQLDVRLLLLAWGGVALALGVPALIRRARRSTPKKDED
jgi:hypothetical protein